MRYFEVQRMTSTTSHSVVASLKAIFARHGIPAVFVSDNGPQFSSKEMKDFATTYGFQHVTSSPHYPQSNGLAERTVKTVKSLLENAADPNLALLSYRATPLPWCHLSPAELLMGRKIHTDVPQVKEHFIPNWTYIEDFKLQDAEYKERQKHHYDRRRRARSLPSLPDDSPVWVTTGGHYVPGAVSHPANTPRLYIINTPAGQMRRTRSDLRIRADHDEADQTTADTLDDEPGRTGIVTRSRSGVPSKQPDRLTYYRM